MGGDRHLKLWLEKPSYMHTHQTEEIGDKVKIRDRGWSAGNTWGIDAKPLLRQDPELREKIWDQVYWSVGPRGMSVAEIIQWELQLREGEDAADEFHRRNWHLLSDDREWEGKCNSCYKRFLLEVNLRTNEVKRIVPMVLHYETDENPRPEWIQTDECEFKLAVEYFHKNSEYGIPF